MMNHWVAGAVTIGLMTGPAVAHAKLSTKTHIQTTGPATANEK
jgi:hypothetical protein